MTETPEALAAEFDTLMARAKLALPPGRRAALLVGFTDLRAMLPLLRQPCSAAGEAGAVPSLAS